MGGKKGPHEDSMEHSSDSSMEWHRDLQELYRNINTNRNIFEYIFLLL